MISALKAIEEMNFSELVGLVNEPNTPSGAHESIRQICVNIPMGLVRKILDVGSNTGFATIEFAEITDAEVIGIDVNPKSVEFARTTAARRGLHNVHFEVGNILDLPFEDATFDMVYCNNVTSFIDDRHRAIVQYSRVLKTGGFLAAVPIYYIRQPPAHIVEAVSDAISARIIVRDIAQWEDVFNALNMRLYYRADFAYDDLSVEDIESYAVRVVNTKRLPELTERERQRASERLIYFYSLFNENLRYCGFSVLIYRPDPANNWPVLHTSHRHKAK